MSHTRRFHPPDIRLLTCEYFVLKDWYANNNVWPFWRIYHNEADGAVVLFNEERIAIGADEIVAIPPGTVIGRRLEQQAPHFYIHATASWPFDAVQPSVHRFPVEAWILKLIDGIKHDCPRDGNRALGPTRDTQLLAIVAHVLGQIDEAFLPQHSIDPRIARVLTYVDDGYTSNVSNNDLAAIAGLARSSFIRLFTQQMGKAPQQYVLQKRLDRAAALLAHSTQTIDEIAEHCGFSNRNYFSRIFSKYCGQAPAAFRRHAMV